MARKGDNYADIAKMLMKVDDVADTAKAVDKTADAAKAADVAADAANGKTSSKLLENMKDWTQKSVTDATRAASISKLAGKNRTAFFLTGFASNFTAEIVENLSGKRIGKHASAVIGEVVGSAFTTAAAEFFKGEKDSEEILKECAKAAAAGLFSGLSSQQIGYAIKTANEAGSVARELMKYDEAFGKLLKTFFDELYTAIEIGMES